MNADGPQQRLALVTGGCGPLGWAISTELCHSGARVLAVDVPGAVEMRREGAPADLVLVPYDLTDPAAPDHLVDVVHESGLPLSLLVNNAALSGSSGTQGYAVPFDDQTDEAFDRALELNLSVPFRLARRLRYALADAGGSIVNVASIYGLVGPDLRLYDGTSMGNPAGYSASKGGLVALTRYLAVVMAPDVRVNCVAPGGLERGQDPEFVRRYVERTPLGRMGSESDVVGAVVWLAGPQAQYVTGQVIAIDGGWTAW